MAEIKTPVVKATEGERHTFGPDEYLITENHTLSDILRFLLEQCGDDPSEILHMLEWEQNH